MSSLEENSEASLLDARLISGIFVLLIGTGIGVWVNIQFEVSEGIIAIAIGVILICLVLVNLEKFASFSAFGISAEMRKKAERVEITLQQIKLITLPLLKEALRNNVKDRYVSANNTIESRYNTLQDVKKLVSELELEDKDLNKLVIEQEKQIEQLLFEDFLRKYHTKTVNEHDQNKNALYQALAKHLKLGNYGPEIDIVNNLFTEYKEESFGENKEKLDKYFHYKRTNHLKDYEKLEES